MKFLNEVIEKLTEAGSYNRQDFAPPAVILWPDEERQWEGLILRLREKLPHFLTYGDYDKDNRTGPGIWLKCMIARSLPEADWDENVIPVIYLPGVSRAVFRDVEKATDVLKPLMELPYRGTFWTQKNHKDWTLIAFLQSEDGGLGLDIKNDEATRDAIKTSLAKLADFAVDNWHGKRLEAEDFTDLVAPDLNRMVLEWMNDPKVFEDKGGTNEWKGFLKSCKSGLSFDPEQDGQLVAAEKLGGQDGKWQVVWQRFTEAPARYPNIPELLDRADPKNTDDIFYKQESWPGYNREQEADLQKKLEALADKTQPEGVKEIQDLEKRHSHRRDWVWSELGQSECLVILQSLNQMATGVAETRFSGSPEEMGKIYVEKGWKVDAAALQALAAATDPKHEKAAIAALRCVYLPWMEEAAKRLQEQVEAYPETVREPEPKAGTIWLFVDGLRLDVGKQLASALKRSRFKVEEEIRWAALPTVTATAKPAASPIADLVTATEADAEFYPSEKESGNKLTTDRFRKLLEAKGVAHLVADETGDPEKPAWTECGTLDHHGHNEGWKLARRIEEEIKVVITRVKALRDAGWSVIRIVTDHGWLIMPGNLSKTDLPKFLTESRWGRAALVKEGNKVDLPAVPWHWNKLTQVAVPPAVSCFKNFEYSHGGVSLQECVTPILTVSEGVTLSGTVKISDVKWMGLRCKAQVESKFKGLEADLRAKVADAGSSALESPVVIAEDGTVSMLVPNDDRMGQAAFLVILKDGEVLTKEQVEIGG